MCQALFYSKEENGHSPYSHRSYIQTRREGGETQKTDNYVICLFVINEIYRTIGGTDWRAGED